MNALIELSQFVEHSIKKTSSSKTEASIDLLLMPA